MFGAADSQQRSCLHPQRPYKWSMSCLSSALSTPLLPLCVQIVTGKFSLFTGLLQQTKVYDLLTAVDEVDRPLIDGLMKKVNTARDLVRKATPEVAATSGN